MTPLAAAAAQEIEALHAHFVKLFTGRSVDLKRCAAAFSPAFTMVTPGGVKLDRAAILAGLAVLRAPTDFRIAIADIRPVWEGSNSALLQYVEQQYRDGKTTRRLSAALFEFEADAPCGVVWRYLHETWMRDAE